jgi:membrane associated rhomboid family serine protease
MPFRFPKLTPTVKRLLIALAGAFVLTAVLENIAGIPIWDWLALDLSFNASGGYLNLIWQPFTYWMVWPPVPEALLQFSLTLLFMYFFLAPFEEAFGAKRTIQIGVVGILAAAIPTLLLAVGLHFAGITLAPNAYKMYGAEPLALAAFGAFPIIARGGEIYFMFLVRMKSWHVVLLGLGFAALSAVLGKNPFTFTQYAGALGGGVLFASWMLRPETPKKKPAPKKRRTGGPELRVLKGGGGASSDDGGDDDQPRWLN